MIVFDTGPIVAAATVDDAHFLVASELFAGLRPAGRRLLLPSTVAAEAGYLLATRVSPAVEVQFLRGVAEGAFEVVDLTRADYARMADLAGRYVDLPLGTTDASVVAVAERLGVTEIATLDRRHFGVVRPRHVAAFTLLPEVL